MLTNKTNYHLLRKLNLLGLLICSGLLGFAAYLQLSIGLPPCPLCILQRVAILILAFLFLIGALHTPRKNWYVTHTLSILFFSVVGFVIASRQIWVEQHPISATTLCGPSLGYMLRYLPLKEVVLFLTSEVAHCARVNWSFLGMSIPEWTRLFFGLFILLGVSHFFFKKPR